MTKINIKDFKPGLYLSLASVLFAIAAMIAYLVLSSDGENTPGAVYSVTLLAIAIQLVILVFNHGEVGKNKYNTGSFLAPVLFTASLILFILGRLDWIIQVQAHNANYAPMHASFYVAIVVYALTIAISIAASFMSQIKQQEI
ncbi:MAG: hypothetical protein LBT59_02825 [Clostridiales bacterium]|jgi:hypothetical protein|nr:hypothetical protein [Clostridiales bacterium]